MSSKLPTYLGLGLALVTGAIMSWMMSRRKKWRAVGKLSKMYIYPMKSGHYKIIDEAECTPLGLRYEVGDGKLPIRDRVFVVYDPREMTFECIKKNNRLLHVVIEPKDDKTMVLSYPGKKSIEITLSDKFEDKTIEMWFKEQIRISDCGDDAAEWISEAATGDKIAYRLGYWPEQESWRRDISYRKLEFKVFKFMTNKYTGAYADTSSYSLINDSSIQDVNTRIDDVDSTVALNFRPNFVIEGAKPYEEDKWHWVKIGDVVFECFRPTTRCIAVTISSDTAEKNLRNEPLKSLRKYRTMKMLGEERVDADVPVMGVYMGLVQGGKIKCGDSVYVSD